MMVLAEERKEEKEETVLEQTMEEEETAARGEMKKEGRERERVFIGTRTVSIAF